MVTRKVTVDNFAAVQAAYVQALALEERKAKRMWLKAIRDLGAEASDGYAKNGDAGIIIALDRFDAQAKKTLIANWRSAALRFANMTARDIAVQTRAKAALGYPVTFKAQKTKQHSFVDAILAKWTSELAGEKGKVIERTQADALKVLIRRGLENGDSHASIAKSIQYHYSLAEDYYADRIARTETHAAANAGSLAGAEQTGVVHEKVWRSAYDGRTRSEHADADGQTVSINGGFTVDGELLDHPGDPSGSASNVINCRCFMTYKVDG